jgi:hypothetical protein
LFEAVCRVHLNGRIKQIWGFLYAFFFFSVCKGAKADIVFLTDASWSIGDDNFNKVVKFIFNTVGAFDEISPAGIQVSVNLNTTLFICCVLLFPLNFPF